VTHCRFGGKYDTSLMTNLLMSPTVKKFEKSVDIYQSYEQISSGTFFYGSRCRLSLFDITVLDLLFY